MSKSWHDIYKERGHSYGNAPDPTTTSRGESPDERRSRLEDATRRDERAQGLSPHEQALADLHKEAAQLREAKKQQEQQHEVGRFPKLKPKAPAKPKKEKPPAPPPPSGAKEWKVPIRNKKLAGKRHEITGVPFDKDGFPDFKDYLKQEPGKLNDVKITPTGKNSSDFAAANKAAGYDKGTPEGYTWHHHQERGRMQLVETTVHRDTAHTGKALW